MSVKPTHFVFSLRFSLSPRVFCVFSHTGITTSRVFFKLPVGLRGVEVLGGGAGMLTFLVTYPRW